MKASELVARVKEQIARHGDLEIMADCDSMLMAPACVQFISEAYLPAPLLVIMLAEDGEPGGNLD
jgi:hypothetical protein